MAAERSGQRQAYFNTVLISDTKLLSQTIYVQLYFDVQGLITDIKRADLYITPTINLQFIEFVV